MELSQFYKSVLEQDTAPVVLCDLDHTIVYMNPAAIRSYAKRGGAALVGRSLMDCHPPKAQELIIRVLDWFRASTAHNRIYEFRNDEQNKDVYMIALRDDDGNLIGYYEKHEFRSRETAALYDLTD